MIRTVAGGTRVHGFRFAGQSSYALIDVRSSPKDTRLEHLSVQCSYHSGFLIL